MENLFGQFSNELFVLSVALVFLIAGYRMGVKKESRSEGILQKFKSQGSTDEPEGDLFNDQLRDYDTGERVDTIK